MMPVVVDQQKTRTVVFNFESAPRMLKFRERLRDFFERNTQLGRKRDHAKCIVDVVLSRNVQDCVADFFLTAINGKAGGEIIEFDVSTAIIGAVRQAVTNRAVQRSTDTRRVRIVRAEKDFSARLAEQLIECLLDRGQVGVKVEMFLLYIKYQGALGMKQGNRSIAFVAFGHEIFAARVPVRIAP